MAHSRNAAMSHGIELSEMYRPFTRNYGSRRGFVRTYWYRFLYILGGFRRYRQIDWQPVERLVFVCKGNICRSAYAEVVARSLGIEAVSCGLDTVQGAPADEAAAQTARKRGFSLEKHRTMPIMNLALRETDLLVVMEPWQMVALENHIVPGHSRTLLGLWARPALPLIQDPYGRGPDYFDKCFERIEDSVHEIAKNIA